MKTLKLIFKAVVVSILSLAPTAWAQIVATNSVTSGIIYVVDTDVGTYGTTTYDCQANVTATVSPYISSSGGDVYLLSATLTANNWVGAVSGQQDAGQGVLLFGQNGTIGSTSNPFHGSAITVTSPDYWYSGTYQAIVDDYNSESPITFNFGVSGGPFSLSISPNNNSSIMLNGPSSGLNGQIFMEDTATAPLGHTRYSGVFINGENISLQQFYLAEGQGGGEIGHITLTFPLTGGHTYWYGSPVLDSLTTGPTVTVPLSYVRGDYIPQPTAGISAKNYSINIGGQSTLIVTVTNRSQAVSLASGQVVLDTSSLGGLSVVGASSQSLGVIATNSSKNYTFTIQGASVGSFSPQISINNGQWGWPAGGKDSFSPLVASLPSSIVVILPAPTISAATSISSSGFTANWNSVSGATGYRLDVSTSSSFSSYVSGYQNMDAGNTTSQNVTGLNSGTSYYYRVRAYNSSSTSGNSGTTTTTTLSRIISLSGNLAFGSVTIGSSPQNALTIYNNGNSTMTVSSISCPSGFSVNWSGTIVAGGSQPVTVTFSPTSAISYGGTATVYSDMTSGVNTIAASGTGTTTPTRIISLNGNLAFGNVTVNSSAQSTLTINNTGNSTMTVSSISYPSGFSGNWSGAIPAGNSQNVTVTFSPISATSYGGTVTVNSDMNGGVNTISASGTGTVLPTPILSLSGNLTFGNVTVGTSTQNTLTISNIGNSTMTVSNINYPSGFGGNWSGAISAGNSQNVTVTFSPTSATSYGGTVTVNSDAASGGNTIIASGTGVVIPTTTPQITNVVFSGSAGNYTITVTGWGLGSLTGLPITGTTTNLSLVDFTQIGHAEWGYSGDGNHLTYQSWADNQFQVSGFGGQPGDAITIAIWNPTTGAGATWGGNVPGSSGTPPQITSVVIAGSGTNLLIRIFGSGFGNAPTNLPFVGDVNQFIFQDHFTHSGTGSFESGGNRWGHASPDSVTLNYQTWSDKEIVINGFAGAYGQGNNVLQNSDPVTIVLWNTSDTSQTGPQTAWGGFVSELPLLVGSMSTNAFIVNVFGPAGSNCVFQASADLRTWVSIYTNTISSGGSFQFIVPATNSCLFFRSFIR